jgi:cell division protein FtsW
MATLARLNLFPSTDISALTRWWGTIDLTVFAIAAMLMTLGLVFSFASSGAATDRLGISDEYYFVLRQAMFVCTGASVMIALSFLSPAGARRAAGLFYVMAVVLMIYILAFGHEAKGAQRWLRFGGFSFQPSEVLKPSLVVIAAWLFSTCLESPTFPAARIALALYAVPVILLILQPDIGQTGLLTLAFLTVFFIAGMPWVWIAGFFGAAVVGCAAIYVAFEHVQKRVNGFLNPQTGETYQTDRALDAIASGNFLGKGPGEGSIKDFLPDAHTDFIYSVAAEEFGLIASVGLIGLFCILIVPPRRGLPAIGSYGSFHLNRLSGGDQFGCEPQLDAGQRHDLTFHLVWRLIYLGVSRNHRTGLGFDAQAPRAGFASRQRAGLGWLVGALQPPILSHTERL